MSPSAFTPHSTRSASSDEMQEMILLTLARAEENHRPISSAEIGNELDKNSTPLLDRLLEKAWIQIDSMGKPTLTLMGRERARTLLRRHRLAERLYTDLLHLDWARAHEEADKLEHVIPSETEAQLAIALGDPATCPHGNPIPRLDNHPVYIDTISLTDCVPRTSVVITRIAMETSAALQHLATLGLLPNVEIVIENKAPLGGPFLIRVGRAHYALGYDLAARIWVRSSSGESISKQG